MAELTRPNVVPWDSVAKIGNSRIGAARKHVVGIIDLKLEAKLPSSMKSLGVAE